MIPTTARFMNQMNMSVYWALKYNKIVSAQIKILVRWKRTRRDSCAAVAWPAVHRCFCMVQSRQSLVCVSNYDSIMTYESI
jgi:hypothetical protein